MNSSMPLLRVTVISRFPKWAPEAFMAVRVTMKSSMERWTGTKCSPAWPPSTVLKSRRMMSGLPWRRASAEV